MKKRIIAILLSLSVFFCSLSCGKRASAAPAVGAIMAIGVLAWEIIGVCTGMYDDTAAAIGEFIESGVDGFINPDSEFQQNWSAGWNTICNTVEGWFNNGELQIEDGQIKLTYDQFHELYGQVVNVMSKPEVDFDSGFNCVFLDVDLSKPFTASDLPQISEYIKGSNGQSYGVVYFNDDTMIFSDYYLYLRDAKPNFTSWFGVSINFSNNLSNAFGVVFSTVISDMSEFLKTYPISIYCPTLEQFSSTYSNSNTPFNYTSQNCYVYSEGTVVYKPVSEVDTTGMKSGLVTSIGTYGDFLKSVKGYTPNLVPPANLTNLSDVLPTEYNPSLSFPVDPDLTRPLPNQVIVGDVPGVGDLPLSEYQAEIKTEIEVPSIICTKFPFCIPYDFIRFLGLLCSDPVAPVFRIPISTSPDNLEQWSGNVTVNEYLNPDDLMFEIDEEIVIDLSVIPLVQPICYTCFIVGFIFLLLHITPKMIQH